MLLRMIKVLLVLKRMLSSGLGNHLHEESHLHPRERGLLQIEGLILQFVVVQTNPLLGVVTEDQDLPLEDVLLHHLEGIGHQCGGVVVAAHHHADAPLGLLDAHLGLLEGGHHPQGG